MRPEAIPLRKLPAIVWVLAGAIVLYVPALGYSPPYLAHDEVFFALNGHSIATTGRDINGRFLPLYFQWPAHVAPEVWFQPIPVYFTSLALRVLPLSEWSIRIPTVAIALADVALVYVVALEIFREERPAVVASVLLALTPAHLIHSRLAMDFLYPLPFMLAWLLCLLLYLRRARERLLFAATSFLGVGFFSYIASVVMMPLYFVMTCALLWTRSRQTARQTAEQASGEAAGEAARQRGQGSARQLALAAAGFGWPLLILIPWLARHLPAIADTAGRYGLTPAAEAGRTTMETSVRFLAAVVERISVYWRFFDPAYLFIAGGGYAVSSTHRVGVFLLPLSVCLVYGLVQIVSRRPAPQSLLLVAGFATAPLAAAAVGEPYAIQRELLILPFAAIVAAYGVERLVSAGGTRPRLLLRGLVVLLVLQFGVFYVDYFTAYRSRSAFAFDENMRGAMEALIERTPADERRAVYLSSEIRFVDLYWKLYAIKHRREDLLARTVYVQSTDLDPQSVPPGSLMLVRTAPGARPREFRRVAPILNIDRTVCCEILERLGTAEGAGGS